jgi:hypothetical protein
MVSSGVNFFFLIVGTSFRYEKAVDGRSREKNIHPVFFTSMSRTIFKYNGSYTNDLTRGLRAHQNK